MLSLRLMRHSISYWFLHTILFCVGVPNGFESQAVPQWCFVFVARPICVTLSAAYNTLRGSCCRYASENNRNEQSMSRA